MLMTIGMPFGRILILVVLFTHLLVLHSSDCSPDLAMVSLGSTLDISKWFIAKRPPTLHPLYSHASCMFMKARYNCAKVWNRRKHMGESADDWVLALSSSNTTCLVRHMIGEDSGNSSSLAHIYDKLSLTFSPPGGRPANILLLGDSFLRQIWEALACRFSHHLTGGFVQIGGIVSNITHINLRHMFPSSAAGDLISVHKVRGCHGRDFSPYFYRPDVPLPAQTSHCNDDLAMAEIDGKLRFYFVFRPYIYKDLEGLLSLKMRLNLSEVDVIVYNDSKRTRRILPLVRKSARPQEIDLTQFFQYMYRLTIRDTGRWFGADNPSIPLPPDFHPCMPGVPDDEADVLLLMLRHGLWALHTGEKGTG